MARRKLTSFHSPHLSHCIEISTKENFWHSSWTLLLWPRHLPLNKLSLWGGVLLSALVSVLWYTGKFFLTWGDRYSRPTTKPLAALQGTRMMWQHWWVVSLPLISPALSQVSGQRSYISLWISMESGVRLARRLWLATVLTYRVPSSSRRRGNNPAPSVLHSAQHITLLSR